MTLLLQNVDEDFLIVLKALTKLRGDVRIKDISSLTKSVKKIPPKPKEDALIRVKISTNIQDTIKEKIIKYENITKEFIEYEDEISTETVFDDSQDRKVEFKNVKVMVVEDNPINQKLMKHILTDPEITVTVVENGELAIEQRIEKDFDLIFMDISMPVMDGIEATRQIKAYEDQNHLKSVPIIAVTANALKGDRERFMAEGLDEYCTKPIKKDTIRQMLEIFLPDELKIQNQITRTVIKKVPKKVLKTVTVPKEVIEEKIITRPITLTKVVNESSLLNSEFVNFKDALICLKDASQNLAYKDILKGYKVDASNELKDIKNFLQNSLYKIIITDKKNADFFGNFIKDTNPISKVGVILKNDENIDFDFKKIAYATSKEEVLSFAKRYI